MSELQLSPEEQEYWDAESGGKPATEKPVETKTVETEEVVEDTGEQEEQVAAEAEADEDKKEEEQVTEQPHAPKAHVRIRELKQANKELKANYSKMQERLDYLASMMEQKDAPDPYLDPEAHREHLEQRLAEKERIEQETKAEQTKRLQAEEELAELQDAVLEQELEYREAHPDYEQAIVWGKKEYASRLVNDYGMTPEDAEAKVFEDIKSMAKQLQNMRGNVAHYLYQQARAMGWGKQQEQTTQDTQKQTTNTDDLKVIDKGQKAARNPRGGGKSNQGLTLEDLAAMDDEEFHKQAADMKKLQKMFGG